MGYDIDWSKEFSWAGGGGSVNPKDIEDAVNKYLTEHPPTVAEGSITPDKLDADIQESLVESVATTTEVVRIMDDAHEDYDTFKEVGDSIIDIKANMPKDLGDLTNDAGYLNDDDAMEPSTVDDIWDNIFNLGGH